MGTAHQPVQWFYFCPHNEKYFWHLELSWKLRRQKLLVKIEKDPKGWRTRALIFAAHTVITSGGCKQEGLEFTSQNEAFPAKKGSSHHVRERLHHLLRESAFSFSESQTSCFITSGFSGSSWSQWEAAFLWSWSLSSSLGFTHPQRRSSPRPPQLQETQQGPGTGCRTGVLDATTEPGSALQTWPRIWGNGGIFVGRAPREERKPWEYRGAFGEENSSTGLLSLLLHTRNLLLPDTAQQVLGIYYLLWSLKATVLRKPSAQTGLKLRCCFIRCYKTLKKPQTHILAQCFLPLSSKRIYPSKKEILLHFKIFP